MKQLRLFVADVVLMISQSLMRWGERLDHLHTRLDPSWKDIT